VLAADGGGITVAAGDGALRLVTVQLEGEPELPASTFAVAYGIAPGAVLSVVPDPGPRTPDPTSSVRNGDPQ
jgi:hypothetical protein